jgi:DNA-directed RNA polymerase specialized sigma subunit
MDKHKAIIEILAEYKSLEAQIRDIEMQIKEFESLEEIGISAIDYSKDRISQTYKFNSIVENQALRVVDATPILRAELIHKQTLKQRIDNAMDVLTEEEKTIIKLKFIDDMKWYRVAIELLKSERSCKQIGDKALEKLEKILF